MKALVRDEEIICEPWSQWVEDHLVWLTTARPNGDGYALCEDCSVPDPEPQDFDITSVSLPDPSSPEEEPSTITRLIATFNKEKYDARKEANDDIQGI